MAPPPGAKHVHIFIAVANTKDFRAPGAQRDEYPNARCVLRSGQRSLSFQPSIKFPFDWNRNFSDRVTHPTCRMAPPPGAKHVHIFIAVANTKDFRAPGAQRDEYPNARCVLRSGQRSLNFQPSIKLPFDWNRNFSDRVTHPTCRSTLRGEAHYMLAKMFPIVQGS